MTETLRVIQLAFLISEFICCCGWVFDPHDINPPAFWLAVEKSMEKRPCIFRITELQLRLFAAALLLSNSASAVLPPSADAQGLPIGLGVGLGMGILSHAARHRSSSSYSNGSGRSYGSSSARRTHNSALPIYNKAVHLFNDKKYDEAEALFEQSAQVDPKTGNTFALLGVCKLKQDRYADAMEDFVLAHNYGNKYPTLLYEQGMCAAHLRDYAMARDCFQSFLSSSYEGPQKDAAQKAFDIIQHNFVAQSDDNYLSEASGQGAKRWSNASQPLKVFIEENPNLQGYHPEFAVLLKQSFDEWSTGTNGQVSFAYTNNPSDAQIKCSWTDNQADLGDTRELGLTYVRSRGGAIELADIKLFTLRGFCRDDASELFPQAKCVALHEIGHALGLQHSNESFDTMFPIAPPKGLEFDLTKRDRNTVAALYGKKDNTRESLEPRKHCVVVECSDKIRQSKSFSLKFRTKLDQLFRNRTRPDPSIANDLLCFHRDR